MPTFIEQRLLSAIRAGQAYQHEPVRYSPESRTVYMHGLPVVELTSYGLRVNLQGWNTPPVRNVINAVAREVLGRPVVSSLRLRPLLDSRPMSPTGWHAVGHSPSVWPTAPGMDPRTRAV